VDRPSDDSIWHQALEVIAQQVNEGTYKIWFEPTAGLGLSGGVYSVGVASDFAKDWIETRFRPLMSEAVSQVIGDQVHVEIVVVPGLSRPLPPDASGSTAPRSESSAPSTPHCSPRMPPQNLTINR